MASSLANAQPLPPLLEIPEQFEFAQLLEGGDEDILSIRNMAQPEYTAFAVLQIILSNMNRDVARIVS